MADTPIEFDKWWAETRRRIGVGDVYFIGEKRRGEPIKIGYSIASLGKRLAALRREHSKPLVVLASFMTLRPKRIEQELHSFFGQDRIDGEWFRRSPLLVSYVKCVRRLGEYVDPREVERGWLKVIREARDRAMQEART